MLKHILLVLALLMPSVANAQQWTVGDQGANWNVLSTKPMGAAPADAYEPADIALPVTVDLSVFQPTVADMLGTPNYLKAADREKKARFECEPAPVKIKDNILGKGIKKFGHPHMGFGSVPWDENTTFLTIRANPRSTCAGGPVNPSNYMEPATLKPMPNGAIVAVTPDSQINYYFHGNQLDPNDMTWLRNGLQFLMGGNPRDMNDTARRAVYAAAGIRYPGSDNRHAGVLGWTCQRGDGTGAVVSGAARAIASNGVLSTSIAIYLRGPNGEDPFGGTCVANGATPAVLASNLVAPPCWDRHNLTSPDGRGHFWYSGTKPDNSVTEACPTTTAGVSYGKVPELSVSNRYSTMGFSDYGNWYFDSDRMRVSTTECPDATAPCDGVSGGNVPATVNGVYYSRVSISPCRRVSTDYCNGETLHADYTFGWRTATSDLWQRECLGIPVRGIAPTNGPAECNTNIVSRYSVIEAGTV